MKIYIGHSRQFDFQNELYLPIRNSVLNDKFEFVLPHEKSNELFSSKDFFKGCDLMLAEISYPSLGLGIEMGWADAAGVKIICLVRKGEKISQSAASIASRVVEYVDGEDLVTQLSEILEV